LKKDEVTREESVLEAVGVESAAWPLGKPEDAGEIKMRNTVVVTP